MSFTLFNEALGLYPNSSLKDFEKYDRDENPES
jgi:hypothetical protein